MQYIKVNILYIFPATKAEGVLYYSNSIFCKLKPLFFYSQKMSPLKMKNIKLVRYSIGGVAWLHYCRSERRG
jgi:hypothetical protein